MGRMDEVYQDEMDSRQQHDDEQQQFETIKEKKMTTAKAVKEVTPIGYASWAHIHSPKKPFTDKNGQTKGDPKFCIDVVFSKDDAGWNEWANDIMAKMKALPEQVDKKTGDPIKKQNPIKRELDADDNPTGRFYVSFKTSDKFKPGVFDKYGEAIPDTVMIGNGSKVRVNYSGNIYDAFGGGINFYLNAVQVIELVEAGVLLASGPYLDGSGGLFAFVAADEAELHKVLAQDPFALPGCVAGTRTTGWNPVTGLLKEYAQGA